jgi:hypothetical protein
METGSRKPVVNIQREREFYKYYLQFNNFKKIILILSIFYNNFLTIIVKYLFIQSKYYIDTH